MTLDTAAFRTGMRRLAAGVSLITTASDEGGWGGMTATAVCSVSADPPTLLCCINRSAATYKAARDTCRFAVNVLAQLDKELADRFASARSPADKFAEGLWTCDEAGSPLLESAMAAFDCRVAQAVDVATHGVLFGEIQTIRVRSVEGRPLLYAHGAYGGLASLEAAGIPELLSVPQWAGGTDWS